MPHDDHRFDKRILQRNLLSGVVTQKEYEGYLERLKDNAKEADKFEAALIPLKRKIPTRVFDEEDEI